MKHPSVLVFAFMTRPTAALLKPRKAPRQARSAVTIDAIQIATLQVLLTDGAGRLTTTRVAERAGVSIGTMYQYYPNKEALLFAVVERQLDRITTVMLTAARDLHGQDLATIARGLTAAWFNVKGEDAVTSRAMYAIAAEFDLADLMSRSMEQGMHAIGELLRSASDRRSLDPTSTALVLTAMLSGSVRVVMEIERAEEKLACLRRELPLACQAYLVAVN